ncbi:NADPH-dependent glutamate synthase [Tissierella creatinophila]|uniref:Glutamate synthase [NADPH] small chain n=1 Tax=Tissierella creatinophila DSM 6911 TaxID=1123403 RepID=A0A1U7M6P4_TISCR|nr:NADPH-dependent glutamate synthase [Tissierella creatinophila]OLS02977.1 glutamate synthase [NADPH] small chain [Tissierella creatinophila DSM 6911]
MSKFTRIPIRYQDPDKRIHNFDEVCLGYTPEEAVAEAKRCIQCKNPNCVSICPVKIDIPGFIKEIANEDFEKAARILNEYSSLPAVCGRVCPQEDQCEKTCILGRKGDSIAIGKLERFAADYAIENGIRFSNKARSNGHKVAVIGSGPAGISCAGELLKKGYEVKIFEALHKPGGVLVYGIPEFRLPSEKIVSAEIENLKDMGAEIETNVVVGRTITLKDIFEEGYEAIFIGSGAGLPLFLDIPGVNLNGVFSANEYLTRNNLMNAFKEEADTPIKLGKRVAVIGGGNVAMDAARTAKRLGSDVYVIYRRTKDELPARDEEIENAIEEGINFKFLTNPIEILGDKEGRVKAVLCEKMELRGEDSSGRKFPVKVEDSQFAFEVDVVIMALGTTPNPLIASTAEELEIDDKNRIITLNDRGETSKEGVFAGGDTVTGSATVILAMGAGKDGAKAIDKYIKKQQKELA